MNREIVIPSVLYPLQGDVQSQPGNNAVSVVGIQGVPIPSLPLLGGEVLTYNPDYKQWRPTLRASIQVNGISMSDDYTITVNVSGMITVNAVSATTASSGVLPVPYI